ncbi:MAG: rod shape-determining protein MreC [Planctomycetota bacterium]|nr:rod shape-determining protein MreC [Planctomycetota bacterium]
MARGSLTPQRLLIGAVVVLAILALAPARCTRWVEWFQQPIRFVVAPISDAASFASRTFRPAESATLSEDPQVRTLETEREQFKTLYLREAEENARLRERIEDLQSGFGLMDASTRGFFARVISASSDLFDGVLVVRAGRVDGVTEGDSVAVVNGVHLVGRVIGVQPRTCDLLPVTNRRTALIDARVFIDDTQTSFECQLEPLGDGRLTGPLHSAAEGVEPGQVVRLNDPDWPPGAQMLILGRVDSIAPSEQNPLRSIITVRPDMDLTRVREVVLRVPATDEGVAP